MISSTKYIGMDVHKESVSIAARNAAGKIVMEMCHRDEGQHHSAVFRWATRRRAGHF